MSTADRRRLSGFLAVAGVLTWAVVLVVVLAVSGGGTTQALTTAKGSDRWTAKVLAPDLPAAHMVTPSARPTRQLLTKAAVKAPPVVKGVRRANVGAAHSPRLARQLSGGPVRPPHTMPPGAGARGIDVASYQHRHGAVIDWSQVARAGYKFAFIKASEGNYYVNPYFGSDLTQARAAGLSVAGYAFGVPNVSAGATQAGYAVSQTHYTADGSTMPLALDIEYNPYGRECYGLSAGQMVAWISSFTTEARRLTGESPIIYTTADWWRSCTGDSRAFGADPLWVAGWGPSSPPMPSGWPDWTFWQFTDRGQVPGVSGNVDVSYFGKQAVRLLNPGAQHSTAGTSVRLQVSSLNAATGQAPAFTATGLPRGLSISGSGLISGTLPATASGTFAVTVTGRSPSGGAGSVSFTWTVAAEPPPPSPSPSPGGSSPRPSPTPSGSASGGGTPGPAGSPGVPSAGGGSARRGAAAPTG